MSATILLTGAAGYIASIPGLRFRPPAFAWWVDNFQQLAPRARPPARAGPGTHRVRASRRLRCSRDARVFQRHRPDAVVHFAAFKAVGESVAQPLAYYRNNLGGLVNTCELMREAGCKRMVFSSSATVYGVPGGCRCAGRSTSATNPTARPS